jgi:hypothetical protein
MSNLVKFTNSKRGGKDTSQTEIAAATNETLAQLNKSL